MSAGRGGDCAFSEENVLAGSLKKIVHELVGATGDVSSASVNGLYVGAGAADGSAVEVAPPHSTSRKPNSCKARARFSTWLVFLVPSRGRIVSPLTRYDPVVVVGR